MIKKQFTIYLENKPGVLAKLTKKLAEKKININGISVSESTDVGLVQMVVSNAALTKKILKSSAVPFSENEILFLELPNTLGALSKLVTKLGAAGVNINYVYGTANNSKSESYVIISAPNLKKVEKIWKSIKW